MADAAAGTTASVTVCCISDTHGDHAALRLPSADVLLHGGDFTLYGREAHTMALEAWGRAQPQPAERCILVLGNHENRWVQDGEVAKLRAMLPSWTLLVDEMHTTAGLTSLAGLRSHSKPVRSNDCAGLVPHLSLARTTHPDACESTTASHGPCKIKRHTSRGGSRPGCSN